MKRYDDLSEHQKDKAIDKATEVLVKMIVDEGFYQFHSPIAQKHFYEAISYSSTMYKTSFMTAMESDEIVEELTPQAELMAEFAWYPGTDDYMIQDVVS